MDLAGSKNLSTQMPEILQRDLLSGSTKNILSHCKIVSPKDYEKYSDFSYE